MLHRRDIKITANLYSNLDVAQRNIAKSPTEKFGAQGGRKVAGVESFHIQKSSKKLEKYRDFFRNHGT